MLKKMLLSTLVLAELGMNAHAGQPERLIVGPTDSLEQYSSSPWYLSERQVGDYVILTVDSDFTDVVMSDLSYSFEVVDGRPVQIKAVQTSSMGVYGTATQASIDDFNDPLRVRQDSFTWGNHQIFEGMSALKEIQKRPVVMVFGEGATSHSDVRTVGGYSFITESEIYSSNGSDCGMTKGLGLSSVIGATNNNESGIAGVAGSADLYMAKVEEAVCDTQRYTQDPAAVFEALESISSSSGETGAPVPDVILLTQAFEGPCPTSFQRAINELVDANAVVVASSGDDDGLVGNYYPANCQNVITVASVDEQGYPEANTNLTAHVDVTAPGDSFVASGNNSFEYANSSDYAAAKVAGLVALVKSNYPSLTVEQVRSALIDSAVPYGDSAGECSGGDSCGYGYMNAKQMVDYANSVYDPEFELTHAFTGDSCLAEREVEALSNHMNVCAAFKTNVSMSYADSIEPHQYHFKLIKRPAGIGTWYNEVNPVTGVYSPERDNGIVVIASYDSADKARNTVSIPLLNVDDVESDYAVASCIASVSGSATSDNWKTEGKMIDGDLCFGVTELNSESVTLPVYCE